MPRTLACRWCRVELLPAIPLTLAALALTLAASALTLAALALTLALADGVALRAQGPADAAVRGRVTLPGGAPAAGAALTLSNSEGLVLRRVALDSQGRFLLLRLAPGEYRVQAGLPGFAEMLGASVANISLAGGDLLELDLPFSLPRYGSGRVNSGTNGRSPPGAPRAGEASGRLAESSLAADTQLLDVLPLLSRDPQGAAALDSSAADITSVTAAGADADSESDPEPARFAEEVHSPAAGLSYEGEPASQNDTRQDGLSAQQAFRAAPRGSSRNGSSAPSFGQAAVRALRVFPSTFSAQRGSAGGAVLSISSERGGSRLHGTAFAFDRQSAWAAVNPYSLVQHYQAGAASAALVRPQDDELQVGGSVGLPLADLHAPFLRGSSSHAALFASLEFQRRRGITESSPSAPGFYTLSPTQVALLGNRGVGRAAREAALSYLDGLSGSIPQSDTRSLGFVRLDTSWGGHDQLGGAYQDHRFDAPSGARTGGPSTAVLARGRGSVGDTTLTVSALSGHWLHTFRPGISHDLRGQWAHDLEYETPHLPLPGEPAIGPGGLAPGVSIAPNGFSYGTPASLGRSAYPDEHRLELANSLVFASSRNLLTVGGDWSRIDDHIASLTNAEGTFLYDSGVGNGHAGGLADWITDYAFNVNAYPNGGCPSVFSPVHYFCFRSFTQSFGGADTRFVTHEIAAFVEDALRPYHGLRLTFGLRSDYTLLPIPQSPNRRLDAAFATLNGPASGSTAVFPEDRNNFGPRAAIAWSPRGGRLFTARVGYGLFFGRLPGATIRSALADTALPATTSSIRILPTTETDCPQVANQGFGYPCAYLSTPPTAVAATTSATEFAKNFRMPAVQRASFTLERDAGRHLGFSGEYQIATATQLPTSVDRNIAPATSTARYVVQGGDGLPGLHTGDTFEVPLYTSRPSAQYGPISTVVSGANATFHALTFAARLQGPEWMQAWGSFTFSRAIDYAPQTGATPRLNSRFDPYTPGYDKGLSSLHFPERFAGNLILRSTFRHGPVAARALLGGWRIAALATAGSGAPYSYEVFGGTRLSGGHESLNGAGGATYLPSVGRNTLRLPARSRMDLRLGREVALGQRFRLEAFAQTFNLLNSRNLARVQTRAFLIGTPASVGAPAPLIFQNPAAIASEGLTTTPFGQALSSTTGLSRERLLEIGLRLSF